MGIIQFLSQVLSYTGGTPYPIYVHFLLSYISTWMSLSIANYVCGSCSLIGSILSLKDTRAGGVLALISGASAVIVGINFMLLLLPPIMSLDAPFTLLFPMLTLILPVLVVVGGILATAAGKEI